MKRQYGKPEVTFENFTLSANIASSCGDALSYHSLDADCMFHSTYGDPNSCVFYENDFSVFLDLAVCDLQPDGESWSQVCYHVITDDMKAFTS